MELLIIIAFLILSAVFSGSETAFVSANRLKFEIQKRKGEKRIATAHSFLSNPARFLSTTLVGNNLVVVVFSSVMTMYLVGYVNESLIVLIASVLLLFFGEILPKSIAQKIPNRSVKVLAPFLRVIEIFLLPVIWISQKISQAVMSLFGLESGEVGVFFAKEDLPILLRETENDDNFGKDQQKLLERVIRIGTVPVKDIMVPRTDMVTVEENDDFKIVQEQFLSSGFSRLPVYRKKLDDIVGVMFARDQITSITLQKLKIRPIPFFPETKRALDALRELRKQKISMAIIVDEYGGTAGLVTIEDLVEELFGEIRDEHDKEPKLFYHLDEKTLMVNARTEIVHLNERFNIELPPGDYVTVGGLVLNRLGHIPVRGENIDLPKCSLIVLNATPTKVEWIRVTLKDSGTL